MVFPAKFEKGTFDMQIVLDGRGLIAGLLFKPHAAAKPEPEKHQAQLSQTERYTKVADQLKELINAGDYAGIQTNFNKEMGEALPLDKSSEFFNGLTQQVGKIQKLGKPQPVGEAMVFPTEFEKDTLDMQITLDGRGMIAGSPSRRMWCGNSGSSPSRTGSWKNSLALIMFSSAATNQIRSEIEFDACRRTQVSGTGE